MTPRRAPSFTGLQGWQQGGPLSITQLRGQIAVVWFFSVSSAPSIAMVPGLAALQRERREAGVQVVGMHTPEFAADTDPLTLARVAARSGMIWPIGMDHGRRVFSRWLEPYPTQVWPAAFVVSRDGFIVQDCLGADVEPVRAAVEQALR